MEVTNKALRIENVERKRAEQALRESEYKLRQIFETEPGLIWSTADGSEGKKAEVQPGFMAQVQAILNVLPAYTWYATPSGSLTFVNKRTSGLPWCSKDHPLRFGIDIGAQWDAHGSRCCIRTTAKKHANTGQTVCARARAVSIVIESVTLKETTAGSSLAPNRSGQAMEPYCCGLG